MLDFAKLTTPTDDGDVLVTPDPADCVAAVRDNAGALGNADVRLLSSTLAEWRRRTRRTVAGTDDAPVIVSGHQPAFIHPGVWAKHIVSRRLADALGGMALNLVVDNDAPSKTTLSVPAINGGRIELRTVRFADLPAGFAYEQIERHGPDETARLGRAFHEALGDRYDRSQLPAFFSGFRQADRTGDWVDQAIAGRSAVEAGFDINLDNRRVSRIWWTPMLADMILHSERFLRCYNGALARYRQAHRVRGHDRPIPDLAVCDGERELPVWVYRKDEPRRRLFIASRGDAVRLRGDDVEIGEVSAAELMACEQVAEVVDPASGWRFRPRALTLTMWARLMLADLFIHGIGGAKYDRIADAIIADYYGLAPPKMACVSATLWMDLPRDSTTIETVRRARRDLRDLRWNPQRHVPHGCDLASLVERRNEAVRRTVELRVNRPADHGARRDAFEGIRRVSQLMLDACPDVAEDARRECDRTVERFLENTIARGREYFFALYDRMTLEKLLNALPYKEAFHA